MVLIPGTLIPLFELLLRNIFLNRLSARELSFAQSRSFLDEPWGTNPLREYSLGRWIVWHLVDLSAIQACRDEPGLVSRMRY